MTSVDGLSWTAPATSAAPSLYAVAFGAGQWMVAGAGGPLPAKSNGALLSSQDGKTWTLRSQGAIDYMDDVGYDGDRGLWAAVGSHGSIVTSPDGTIWTGRDSSTSQRFAGIAYGGGQWMAVGWGGTIVTSADGVAWASPCQAGCPTSSTMVLSVAYGNGTWVAVAPDKGTILTSVDGGTSWASVDYGSVLGHVAFNGTGWAIAGRKGVILTSPDGFAWSDQDSKTSSDLYGLGSDGTRWVAVGAAGTVVQSLDGVKWSPGSAAAYGLTAVATDRKAWVAVGGGILSAPVTPSPWVQREGPFALAQTLSGVAASVAPPLQCTPKTQTVVAGTLAVTSVQGGAAPYSWTAPGSDAPGAPAGPSASTRYDEAGTYTVTVSDGESPPQTSQCTVVVTASPSILACAPLARTVEPGAPTDLAASGGEPPYTWTSPGSDAPGPTTGTGLAATYAVPGNYTVTVTDASPTAQSAQCEVSVVAPPDNPPPSEGGTGGTGGQGATGRGATVGEGQYNGWQATESGPARTSGSEVQAGQASSARKGNATVDQVVAPAKGAPAEAPAAADPLAIGNETTGLAVLFGSNRGAGTFGWDFGDGSATDGRPTPTHTYAMPGTYTVHLLFIAPDGQFETAAIAVHVTGATAAARPLGSPAASAAGWPWAAIAAVVALVAWLAWWLVRRAWPNFVMAFFSRLRRSELAEHPVRAALLDALAARPGIHEPALARLVDKDRKTVDYHLRILRKAGLVRKERWQGMASYWLATEQGPALPSQGALRGPNAQNLLRLIESEPGVTYSDLMRKSGLKGMSVHYHLKRLQKAGLVSSRRLGNRVHLFGANAA